MKDISPTINHVLYLEEENARQTIILKDDVYSIGRHTSCNIILKTEEVSRHHATLMRKEFNNNQMYYLLIDGNLQGKKSQNGILVNGQEVIRHKLNHGDIIVFGSEKVNAIYQRQEISPESINGENPLEKKDLQTVNESNQKSINLSRDELQQTLIVSEKNLSNTLKSHNLTRLSSFPELCPYPIIEIDWQGNVTYANPSAKLTFENLFSFKLDHPLFAELTKNHTELQGKLLTREISIDEKTFEQYVHYLSEDNSIRSYIFDITQRKESESMLRYQSLHDSLTGLPNRDFFYQELDDVFDKAKKESKEIALFYLDLDRFKNINDTLNHTIGDKLLQEFTTRMRTCLNTNMFLARWGGDEFTLIIKEFTDIKEIEDIAYNIKNTMKEPFFIDNHVLHVSTSIGIAIYPQDAKHPNQLIKNADSALYKAKEHGRNNHQFYLSKTTSHATLMLTLENYLYKALENNELFLCYQPQININRHSIHGFEALIRWQHPELGQISPAKFIPLAEETGLIIPIGEWVLETACQQNKAWQLAGLPSFPVAVNLSALQFREENLTKSIINILKKTKLNPQFLELEITEGLLMQDVESAQKIIRELLDIGVTFSLDDFGTGYSSLGYLKKFPFDTIKIDKSFVQDLSDYKRDSAIISAVITIANGFDMTVVAEGVETTEQLNLLKKLKCEIIQGRLFSYPLNADKIPDFILNLK